MPQGDPSFGDRTRTHLDAFGDLTCSFEKSLWRKVDQDDILWLKMGIFSKERPSWWGVNVASLEGWLSKGVSFNHNNIIYGALSVGWLLWQCLLHIIFSNLHNNIGDNWCYLLCFKDKQQTVGYRSCATCPKQPKLEENNPGLEIR